LTTRIATARIGLLLAAALLAGCSTCSDISGFFVEPEPDLENPNTYGGAEVAFRYPGNWKATESILSELGVTAKIIELESPGNAYLAVQVFNPALPIDVSDMLDETTRMMQQEMARITGGLVTADHGVTVDCSRQLLGALRQGKRRSLSVEVLGERVPHTVEIYVVEISGYTIVVLTTGADEDMSRLGPGYALALDTLQVVAQPAAPPPATGAQAF
jgi:hypothetical protein